MEKNYQDIKRILEESDLSNVVKAIFSFEAQTDDEELLNDVVEFFFNHKNMPSFLNEEIHYKLFNE